MQTSLKLLIVYCRLSWYVPPLVSQMLATEDEAEASTAARAACSCADVLTTKAGAGMFGQVTPPDEACTLSSSTTTAINSGSSRVAHAPRQSG